MAKLFVYGNAQIPGKPQDMWVQGELRRCDPKDAIDVAAKFGPGYSTKVYGQVLDIPTVDLAHWCAFELPEYDLRRVTLGDRTAAYAFEYSSQDFELMEPIVSGRFVPTPETIKESEKDDDWSAE